MRLDTVARLSLVRCRIPQLIPSHRMARHARTLQQAALLSSATSTPSSSSSLQLVEQQSIEESIVAHRRLAMGDSGSATASSPQSTPHQQTLFAAAAVEQPSSHPLSIVVPATASESLLTSSSSSSSSSSSPASAVLLPSSYSLSPASSAAALPDTVSLSRASSPSPSIVSDCPDSTLPHDDDCQPPSTARCPSPAMSSFYMSPPLPPQSTADQSCPDLDLSTMSDAEELPTSAADMGQSSHASQSTSAQSAGLARRMSIYDEKILSSAPAFSTLPASTTSSYLSAPSSATPSFQSTHPSLVVPKPRRLVSSHPYAVDPSQTAASRHHRQQSQYQHEQQLMQQQQRLLAQHYLNALQHSALPRYLPSATPSFAAPAGPFPATVHFSFPSPSASFSPYLISTLPHGSLMGTVVRV